MITRILSGAYTDVERGALAFAATRRIAMGGWAPLGWLQKTGLNDTTRSLQEVPHGGSPNYAERNILDADGTLLITEGEPVAAADLARNFAARYRRPLIHIDLTATSRFQAAEAVAEWIAANAIEVINITGGAPRATIDLHQATIDLLQAIAHISLVKEAMAPPGSPPSSRRVIPGTMEEAMENLDALLPLEEKIAIGRTPPHDLPALFDRLGRFVDEALDWWHDNDALANSCRSAEPEGGAHSRRSPDEILVQSLWRRFQKRYGLRRVK